jgi:hypothetical protein
MVTEIAAYGESAGLNFSPRILFAASVIEPSKKWPRIWASAKKVPITDAKRQDETLTADGDSKKNHFVPVQIIVSAATCRGTNGGAD